MMRANGYHVKRDIKYEYYGYTSYTYIAFSYYKTRVMYFNKRNTMH